MQKIIEYDDWQRVDLKLFVDTYLLKSGQPLSPSTGEVRKTVKAEANQGRWIVKCPSCTGAQYASVKTPYFFCVECSNKDNKSKWYEVKFPKDKTKIERELLKRARIENRNWRNGETVSDLQKENADRGIS